MYSTYSRARVRAVIVSLSCSCILAQAAWCQHPASPPNTRAHLTIISIVNSRNDTYKGGRKWETQSHSGWCHLILYANRLFNAFKKKCFGVGSFDRSSPTGQGYNPKRLKINGLCRCPHPRHTSRSWASSVRHVLRLHNRSCSHHAAHKLRHSDSARSRVI